MSTEQFYSILFWVILGPPTLWVWLTLMQYIYRSFKPSRETITKETTKPSTIVLNIPYGANYEITVS